MDFENGVIVKIYKLGGRSATPKLRWVSPQDL